MEQHRKGYVLPEDFLSDNSFCNYCKGAPEEDVHYWNEWLKTHSQDASAFHEAERMYRTIGAYDSGYEDALARFSDALQAAPAQQRRKIQFLNVRTAAAAAVVLAAGASLFFLLKPSPKTMLAVADAPRYDTVETANAKIRKVSLPDGSYVTLNGHSRLLIPADYNKQTRKVVLEGEAFFDVATDAAKPFSVESKGVETRVLGTSFNIQAYRERAGMKVTVLTGMVAVQSGVQAPVTLRPDEHLLVKEDGSTHLTGVLAKDHRAWTEGELFFSNETLENMAFTLSMHFDKSFIFEDEHCRKELFTASFEQGISLNKVLHLLSLGRNIRFTQKGDTIMIGKAGI